MTDSKSTGGSEVSAVSELDELQRQLAEARALVAGQASYQMMGGAALPDFLAETLTDPHGTLQRDQAHERLVARRRELRQQRRQRLTAEVPDPEAVLSPASSGDQQVSTARAVPPPSMHIGGSASAYFCPFLNACSLIRHPRTPAMLNPGIQARIADARASYNAWLVGSHPGTHWCNRPHHLAGFVTNTSHTKITTTLTCRSTCFALMKATASAMRGYRV